MLDSLFRPIYQKVCVDPFLAPFKNISPLKITALSCLFGVSIAPLLAFHLDTWALFALVISGYFDTLDGSLARLQKTSSPLGAVLDITSDRLVEFAIILGLYLFNPLTRALPSLLMLGSVLICITSFLVVGIFSHNTSEKSFHYSPGLMERTEAFLFWGAMILFPSSFALLSFTAAALIFLTSALRLRQFFLMN